MDISKKQLEDWLAEMKAHKSPNWDKLPDLDLYMDQVILLMERQLGLFMRDPADKLITPAMINNYVKLGMLTPTTNKKYSRSHIAYLMTICILKQLLPISDITDLLKSQTGKTEIDDLFNTFCEMQDQALHRVADGISLDIINMPESGPEMADRLNRIALNLTVTANAHKLAAEKIIHLLKSENEGKEKTAKEKPAPKVV